MPIQETTMGIHRHGDSIRWSMHQAFSLDTITPGTTEYLLFSGCLAFQANEVDCQALVSRDGHIENIRVDLTVPPGAGENVRIVLRINGNSTGIQLVIANGETRTTSGIALQEVDRDDLVDYEVTSSAGADTNVGIRIVAEMHAYSKKERD